MRLRDDARTLKQGLLLACLTFFLASPTWSETVTVPSKVNGYRALEMEGYRGLPRLGEPSPELDADALERHNYSLGLFNRLAVMNAFPDCFENLQGYKTPKESCANRLINHNSQGSAWHEYIKVMAYSMAPELHQTMFCPQNPGCAATQVDMLTVQEGRGMRRYDEFERRDFAQKLFSQQGANFDRYWRGFPLPEESWHVSRVTLSEYNFDEESFNFQLVFPTIVQGRYTQVKRQSPGIPKTSSLNSRQLSASMTYSPTLGFEDYDPNKSSYGNRLILKMPPGEARKLAEAKKQADRGTFFAVLKIKWLPPEFPATGELSQTPPLRYHLAANKVELFADAALTRKLAETRVFETATGADGSAKASAGDRYTPIANTWILDWGSLNLMRFQQGPMLEVDLDRLAYGIPAAERRLWQDMEQREKAAAREMPAAPSESQQASMAAQKKAMADRARLSHFSWQNFSQLNAGQQQAFYDYMVGRGKLENNIPLWPDALPSVNWGMNLATLFSRDYFDAELMNPQKPVEEESRQLIQRFVTAVARSQNIEHLSLVFSLEQAVYDGDKRALTFPKARVSLAPADNVLIAAASDKVYPKSSKQIASEKARNRILYRFVSSSGQLGRPGLSSVASSCSRNEQRKSTDCGLGPGHLFQRVGSSDYLALDREVSFGDIPMDSDRGVQLASQYGHPGWRLVVELSKPNLDVLPFNYKERNKSGTGEALTLLANVDRILVISPDNAIIWSQDGASLPEAQALTQMTSAEGGEPAEFDATIPGPVLYDFLYARHYPQDLTAEVVEAMISSRWSYEKQEPKPVGGRFFNPSARTPAYSDVQQMVSEYKSWLQQRAADLPNTVNISLPLHYVQDTVIPRPQCFKTQIDPNAPARNSSTNKMLAQNKVRNCENQNAEKTRRFEQCTGINQKLVRAEQKLADAEAADCGEGAEDASSSEGGGGGLCNFPPDMAIQSLRDEMMKCMTNTCGTPGPSTNLVEYQQCAQGVQAEAQEAMQLAMGGGKRSSSSNKRSQNRCQIAKNEVYQLQQEQRSARCDKHGDMPSLENCAALGHVEEPEFMPIIGFDFGHGGGCDTWGYFNRKARASAALLPRLQPRPNSQFLLELSFDKALEIPYEPPLRINESPLAANAVAELTVQLGGINKDNRKKQVISLEATVIDVKYRSPD